MQLLLYTAPLQGGKWALELLQFTASLPGGTGQLNPNTTLPHRLGAAGSGTPAMHCCTALGRWAVELLQCTAAPPLGQWAVQLLRQSVSLPGGQWAVTRIAPPPEGSGQQDSCDTLPHCLGAVGSARPAIHCPTAGGGRALELLQFTTSLPGGMGQWNLRTTLPQRLEGSGQQNSRNALLCRIRAVGSGTPAMHCRTAMGQWVVQLLLYTTSLLGGQWAMEFLQCTASLHWSTGHWISCNAMPQCLGRPGHGCMGGWGVLPKG